MANITDGFESSAGACLDYDKIGVSLTTLNLILDGYGITIISAFGLLGNLFTAIVLFQSEMRTTSSNCILLFLTFCDALVLLPAILFTGLPNIFVPNGIGAGYIWKVFPALLKYLYPVCRMAYTGSVYLVVLAAAERYVAIHMPFKAIILCTKKRMISLSIGVVLFSILYNLPYWWERELIESTRWTNNATSEVIYLSCSTKLTQNRFYQYYFEGWIFFIVQFLIPLGVLLFFNFRIGLEMHRVSQERARGILAHAQCQSDPRRTSSASAAAAVTTRILCVVFVFIACNIAYPVDLFIRMIQNRTLDVNSTIQETTTGVGAIVRRFLVVVNSSVNFLIYCLVGSKFRNTCLTVFGRQRWKSGYHNCIQSVKNVLFRKETGL